MFASVTVFKDVYRKLEVTIGDQRSQYRQETRIAIDYGMAFACHESDEFS
jgi:hypothetical protein